MWPFNISLALVIFWIWMQLIPKVAAPWPNRAPGCGEQPATIRRQEFEDYVDEERETLRALAKAIEEIDYLQEEGRCPSDISYITVSNRDIGFHIQPLIDQLLNIKIQVSQLIRESVEDEADGYGTFVDEAELELINTTIRNLQAIAEAEKDAVDAFLAEIANLPRLRYIYPNKDGEGGDSDDTDEDKNIFNLAMRIDDGHPDGQYLVEYILGARQNYQARFDGLVETMELIVSDYDGELAVHDYRDQGQLDEWFPKGTTYRDIVGALIRWSMCWEEGARRAAKALRAVAPAPKPEDPKPGRWGAVGRGLSQIGRSLSGIRGCRGRSRTPPPAPGMGGNKKNMNKKND
ncbi:hypothetical protein TWF132_008835 [Orbilia oligospora]|nr:hypothetical protein TWF132_008835 [Orbilia oligospora]